MDPLDLIAEGKIKRFFRSTRKLTSPKLISHITQRAAGKEPLFLEQSDYLFMLYLLKEVSRDRSVHIYAFCLMSNHIHLLISPMEGNLSDAMRDLFARYATKFNRKYERKGHLFSGPYRQAVCFDDTYLLAASLYIHMNPVRAGLSESAMKYRWSSCRLYCDPEAPESFVDTGLILRLLADQDEESKKIYLEMLNRSTNLEMNHVLEHENAIARFSSKLTALFPTVFKGAAKRRLVSGHTGLKLQSLEDLEAQIEAIRNANPNRNPVSRNAKKFLIEQLIARGFYKTEIAKRLGISRKTVYNILNSSC